MNSLSVVCNAPNDTDKDLESNRAWFAPRACDMIAFVRAGADGPDGRGAGLAVADGGGGAAASGM